MNILPITLLLLSGIDRGSFALVSASVAQTPVSATSQCCCCTCEDCACSRDRCPALDYSTAREVAIKLKKSLYVAKNVRDVGAEKAKADADGAIFCVSEHPVFSEGVTIYDFTDGSLYKRAPKAVASVQSDESLDFEESCSDGSCSGPSNITTGGKSRRFFGSGSSSCSSCR